MTRKVPSEDALSRRKFLATGAFAAVSGALIESTNIVAKDCLPNFNNVGKDIRTEMNQLREAIRLGLYAETAMGAVYLATRSNEPPKQAEVTSVFEDRPFVLNRRKIVNAEREPNAPVPFSFHRGGRQYVNQV